MFAATLRSSIRYLPSRSSALPLAPRRIPAPRGATLPFSRRIASSAIRSSDSRHQKTTKTCPHCNTSLPLAASPCPKCAQLVPIPADVSYYSLFDLTPSTTASSSTPHSNQERIQQELRTLEGGGYVLDLRDLRTRFFKRQQGCHPDSFTGQGKVRSALRKSPSRCADILLLWNPGLRPGAGPIEFYQ